MEIYNAIFMNWTTASLSAPRYNLAGVSINNKVLFAGGTPASSVVDIFDILMGSWTSFPNGLSIPREYCRGSTINDIALFASHSTSLFVDIYNASTHSWNVSPNVLSMARVQLTVTSVGLFAVFAGGCNSDASVVYNSVDIYNYISNSWTSSAMSISRIGHVCLGSGSSLVCLGSSMYSEIVDFYDTIASSWTTSSLSIGRKFLAGAVVGCKAIFAGGYNSQGAPISTVDIYDFNVKNWVSVVGLSVPRGDLASAAIGNAVYFGPGISLAGAFSSYVDVIVFPMGCPAGYGVIFCFSNRRFIR